MSDINHTAIGDELIRSALEEFECTTFNKQYGHYCKLPEDDREAIAKYVCMKIGGLPRTVSSDTVALKLTIQRLRIEQNRNKYEDLTPYIEECLETLRNTRNHARSYTDRMSSIDWYVEMIKLEKTNNTNIQKLHSDSMFGRYKISIVHNDVWIDRSGVEVVVDSVVEYRYANIGDRRPQLHVIVSNRNQEDDVGVIRNTAYEISDFRKNFDLHIPNLRYLTHYNHLDCNCDCHEEENCYY